MQQETGRIRIYKVKHIQSAVSKFDLSEAKPATTPRDVGCLKDFENPVLPETNPFSKSDGDTELHREFDEARYSVYYKILVDKVTGTYSQ